jgi:hypothetical protein
MRIKDRPYLAFVVPKPQVTSQDDGKTLSPDETLEHLEMILRPLRMLPRFVYEKLPQDGGENTPLREYMIRVADTIEAIGMKTRMELELPRDTHFPCMIDPSASGYPLFARDLRMMVTDKNQAVERLSAMRTDSILVEDAIHAIMRGKFPADAVYEKLRREYFGHLQELAMPEPVRLHAPTFVKEQGAFSHWTMSAERLDDHHNIPRFYTLSYKIPNRSVNNPAVHSAFNERVERSFTVSTDLELQLMAGEVESIEGIQLQAIERYDLGPLFNRFTNNSPEVQRLLDAGRKDDTIMVYKKQTVHRRGETPKQGLMDRLNAFLSGDHSDGIFSPVVSSPYYALMPRRLIEKVHHLDIDLGQNVRMYGITSTGDLVD